jgi:hypothetical protein
MGKYYSNDAELGKYRKLLQVEFRNVIQKILNDYSMANDQSCDFEVQQIENGTVIGTAWIIPLQDKFGNFICVIPGERISPMGHQVSITVQCCEPLNDSTEELFHWLLDENMTLPMGLRYNIQNDIISVDCAYNETNYLDTKMLGMMLLATVKNSENLFSQLLKKRIPFKTLSNESYTVVLPETGAIPERIQKYVRRIN